MKRHPKYLREHFCSRLEALTLQQNKESFLVVLNNFTDHPLEKEAWIQYYETQAAFCKEWERTKKAAEDRRSFKRATTVTK